MTGKKTDIFEKIYRSNYNDVYLYVFSFCKDHSLTEDIVSDTFFKALMCINETSEEIKPWLLRVAKNLWIDHLRKQKKISLFSTEMNVIIAENSTLNQIIIDEQNRCLYRMILALPAAYKEMVVLFYFCELPLNRIADYLGITYGACRNMLYRARKKLKKELEEQNYGF